MLFTPKYKLIATAALLLSSNLHSYTVIEIDSGTNTVIEMDSNTSYQDFISNNNAIITEISSTKGIRTTADFDWDNVNIIDTPGYFEDGSNFFGDFQRDTGVVYDSNIHDFLDAKKAVIVANSDNKQLKSFTNIPNTGFKGYDIFSAPQSYTIQAGQSVTGMGSLTGNRDEAFNIRGGTTSTTLNVTIELREKSEAESYGHQSAPNSANHYNNSSLIGHSPLVGGVMRLHGMGIQAASEDGRVKTNPFALEGTYTQEDFDATYSLTELEELINRCLFLGWLNTAIDGNPDDITDGDRWVHAVQGNFDNMPDNPNRHDFYGVIGDAYIGTLDDYLAGTTTSINGLSKSAGEMRVGDHGGDPTTNTVWAILDHNSDFSVVPEPSTYALFLGIFAIAFRLYSKR